MSDKPLLHSDFTQEQLMELWRWFEPFLKQRLSAFGKGGVDGIRFNVDNEGGWLWVVTNDHTETPQGELGLFLEDTSEQGIDLVARNAANTKQASVFLTPDVIDLILSSAGPKLSLNRTSGRIEINDGDVDMNANGIVGLRDGVNPQDAATVNQIGGGLPDPSGEPDGEWLMTSSGAAVWAAATTANLPDSLNKRYVTDAELAVLAATSGTNTGDQSSVSGNAGSATVLQTSRNIDGQAFNGSANITVVAPGTHAATGKATPVDPDELPLVDSAASNVLKKLTFANLKATLKAYFDTIYATSGGGGAFIATDTIWGAKGDLAVGTGDNTAAKLTVGANGKVPVAASGETAGIKWADGPPGMPVLVYRYTVAGTDKASIDTGADTADAGSNDWANGDLLEMFFTGRTDEAAAAINYDITVNNDTAGNYDLEEMAVHNASAVLAPTLAAAKWNPVGHGSGGTAGYASTVRITIPDFAGTTFNKTGELFAGTPDGTAANNWAMTFAVGYRSTSAISRLKIAAQGTAKLKVGSQLLIYKRLAS